MKLIIVFENIIRDSRTYQKRNGGDDVSLDFKSHRDLGGGGVLLHHGGVLTNKGSPSPSRMYYLVGTSEGTTRPSQKWQNVKRLYFGCVFELLGAFEISQICWGVGWGDRRYPYKLSHLAQE